METGFQFAQLPASIYLLKVNSGNWGAKCESCLKLTIKTPDRRHLPRSVLKVNNKDTRLTMFWCLY